MVMRRLRLNRLVVYCALIAAFVMIIVIVPVMAAIQLESQGNVYYQGGDYQGVVMAENKDVCKYRCINDEKCLRLTWVDPHTIKNPEELGACWLKDNTGLGPYPYPSGSSGESWIKRFIIDEPIPPQPASIPVSSVPAGAAVYLNEVYKGQTPVTITIPGTQLGTYTLKITYLGYNDHTESIVAKSGGNYPVSVNLVQIQTTGSLSVRSTPSGASVYVDTVYQGTTPVTIPQLAPGSHTVRLTLTGYTEDSKIVTITAGQTYPLTVPLTQVTSPTITVTVSSATTGSLQISTTPSGATIILDGKNKGQTPAIFSDLSTGSHTVKLTKSGYWDSSQTVNIAAGKTTPLDVTLVSSTQPAPSLTENVPTLSQPGTGGSVIITSNPLGANVYLDGQSSGTTPLTIPNVNPGTHTILLTMQGYNDTSKTVEVTAGSQNQVSVDMVGGKKTPGFEAALAVFSITGLVAFRMRCRKEE